MDSFFPFIYLKTKNIEYKKWNDFAYLNLNLEIFKEKNEECSFDLSFIVTMKEAHFFLLEFL